MAARGSPAFLQHGDVGEQAEHRHTLQEHRKEAEFRARVGKHGEIAGRDGSEAEGLAGDIRGRAQIEDGVEEGNAAAQADADEYRAPAGRIGDHTCEGGAQQIAGDDDGKPAAQCHLPLVDGHEIADDGHADGKHAAACHAADDARDEHHRVGGGDGADERRQHDDDDARHHRAHLADGVGQRAEHRLNQSERKREGRREQGHVRHVRVE